jgi:hypothetical protein
VLNSSRISTSAAGAGFVPAKPSMSYNTTAKFNITNYSSGNNYILVPNSGSATIDGSGVVTLSSTNAECTISAKGPKGITATATSIIGRKPYTYYYACTAQCASANSDPFSWVLQPYPCNCGPQLNGAPSGYTSGSGEWQRIVN